MKHWVYLGLGSNLGNRQENMARACNEIEKLIGYIVSQSALFHTQPWGFVSDNDFLNAVICCETSLTPRQVLLLTQDIERQLGRTVKSEDGIYHDRTIDIDLLLYEGMVVKEADMQVPHPLMLQRDFVMKPLLEVLSCRQPYFTPPTIWTRSEGCSTATSE